MKISETVQKVHAIAVEKGFWEAGKNKNVAELLMLCVSELSEALEADRKGKHANGIHLNSLINKGYTWEDSKVSFVTVFEKDIKDTFEDELADTVIRIFDLCGGLDIDLEQHIYHKMQYNATRGYKHGKAY